jgi:hypothetical protein
LRERGVGRAVWLFVVNNKRCAINLGKVVLVAVALGAHLLQQPYAKPSVRCGGVCALLLDLLDLLLVLAAAIAGLISGCAGRTMDCDPQVRCHTARLAVLLLLYW